MKRSILPRKKKKAWKKKILFFRPSPVIESARQHIYEMEAMWTRLYAKIRNAFRDVNLPKEHGIAQPVLDAFNAQGYGTSTNVIFATPKHRANFEDALRESQGQFMEKHGLGPEDMRDDNRYPAEI